MSERLSGQWLLISDGEVPGSSSYIVFAKKKRKKNLVGILTGVLIKISQTV